MLYLFLSFLVQADQVTHRYSESEDVILWFNKLVPFHNPQESYSYSTLPLCTGGRSGRKYTIGLGEAVEGYEMEDSGINIKFTEPLREMGLCNVKLTKESRLKLIESVKNNYWLQMYIDDLPMWTSIGEYDIVSGDVYIYTHYSFEISYNEDRIILSTVSFQRPENLKTEGSLIFTYSVSWKSTSVPFSERFQSYLDPGFFENNIHWYSIINSFAMVALLCALVILIICRTISKDFDRYNNTEVEVNEFVETKGWKQVAGDAFKAPEYLPVFTLVVSTGWHLAYLSFFGILTCILHPMYSERGSLSYYLIIEYATLASISGFKCGSIYTKYKGKKWLGTAVFTSLAFPLTITIIYTYLNITATLYSSSADIPFTTILEIAALMVFVYLPLFTLGLTIGRRYQMKRPISQRLNSVNSPILREKKFYNQPITLILAGGLLPFSSIYVEVYYVFTSFWNYKFYYVYGFTLITFILFALSVACIAIVATYSILNSEDYKWHWVSFLSAGSVGFYFYAYSAYYYFFKTSMIGFFQFSFYFAYITVASLCLVLIGGAIGYTASYSFVNRIYSNIKSE